MRTITATAVAYAALIGAAIGLVGSLDTAIARNIGPTPVAVELFTSQGCSSCPPADALLERLALDSDVVAITRPVTYWDRLGWKDTLAREGNTQLQRAYAARGGKGSGVYTPQAIVQGSAAAVGSSESELRQLIAKAKQHTGPAIAFSRAANGDRIVTFDGAIPNGTTVTVVALHSSTTVSISNGENGGRSIRYVNVVVGEQSLGVWQAGQSQFKIPASALRGDGADRAALLLRQGRAGPIIAARYL